jgi:hypothetical protein
MDMSQGNYLKQTKIPFFNKKEQKRKQALFGEWYQREGRGHSKNLKEAGCSRSIRCSCMKMEK